MNQEEVSLQTMIVQAEVAVANFLTKHKLPLATSDHMTKLFKTIFTDSKISAAGYNCARTKTGAINKRGFCTSL